MSYKINHDSYCLAVSELISTIEKAGFTVSDDEVFQNISINGKPAAGETKRISLQIEKNGKVSKKLAHAQVYGLDSGRFELNFYIL